MRDTCQRKPMWTREVCVQATAWGLLLAAAEGRRDREVGGGAVERRDWPALAARLHRYWQGRGIELPIDRTPPALCRPGAVARDNLLLVGEAASAMNRAFGEGMRCAIVTGRLAAQAIVLGGGAAHRYHAVYARRWRPLLPARGLRPPELPPAHDARIARAGARQGDGAQLPRPKAQRPARPRPRSDRPWRARRQGRAGSRDAYKPLWSVSVGPGSMPTTWNASLSQRTWTIVPQGT